MSRPRRDSVGVRQAPRQAVQLAALGLPGDNASQAKVEERRRRVLAAVQRVDPTVTQLLDDQWENTMLGTTFHLPPETTASVAQVQAAVAEEFGGAATASLATIQVPGAVHRTKRETVTAIRVEVFAGAARASFWKALRRAVPYAALALVALFFLWVVWA